MGHQGRSAGNLSQDHGRRRVMEGRRGGAQIYRASTYERDSVRWKRCRRPRNMTNELGGKERAATSQRGPSKAPPAGHWQRKPPSGPSAQVPPLRQTPGTQRPASVSSSQSSPTVKTRPEVTACADSSGARPSKDSPPPPKGELPVGTPPISLAPPPRSRGPGPAHKARPLLRTRPLHSLSPVQASLSSFRALCSCTAGLYRLARTAPTRPR